jgi:acetyl esterase/lipase
MCADAQSGTWRAALMQRRQAAPSQQAGGSLPANIQVIRDVRYGDDPQQRFDVYAPQHADHAPVIMLVHGGGWAFGDKAMRNVIENKVGRWVPRGFIVISIDYRMLPQTPPLAQAGDVALALAYAQQHAGQWGGNPGAFILMGHSAGAHLVALVSVDASIGKRYQVAPWLGTVSLDSAALNVVAIMQNRHLPLYDRAFGSQSSDWIAASPLQQLRGRIVPFLAVCSSQRQNSCPQAHNFVEKAASFGTPASVIEQDLSHEQINERLGLDSDYTRQVEAFMRTLSPSVAQAIDR